MKRKLLATLTTLMTIALIMTFVAIPGMAATSYTSIGGTTTIVNNLVINEDANVPDITFTYTITRGPVPATQAAGTIQILEGAVPATIGNAEFSNADTTSAIAGLPTDTTPGTTLGYKYAQKSITITFPSDSFPKPGVYRYTINQSNSGKPGMVYDQSTKYLDVFVVADNNDVLTVDSYVLRNAETAIGTDGQYVINPNDKVSGYQNSITQFDFEFSKTITGNQGDKNKRFTFTLNISSAIPGTYPVQATDVTGNPTTITIGSDGTFSSTYDLTNGSIFRILNLNQGAVCTVSEDATDYTPSYKLNSGNAAGSNATGSIILESGDYSVVFTNTREGLIPTGVIMSVAPYAIGVCLFGAVVIFLIGRKKRTLVEE